MELRVGTIKSKSNVQCSKACVLPGWEWDSPLMDSDIPQCIDHTPELIINQASLISFISTYISILSWLKPYKTILKPSSSAFFMTTNMAAVMFNVLKFCCATAWGIHDRRMESAPAEGTTVAGATASSWPGASELHCRPEQLAGK